MARSEVYVVDHDQTAHSQWRREGRSREEVHRLLRTRLENQIPAYLGEFILGVRFKEFYYEEKTGPATGQKFIGAPGFVGDIGASYQKAIADAKSRGWSGKREKTESDAFNLKLKPQLFNASVGTFYIWISPPGSKEEGYGDYSFTHLGQVQKTSQGQRRYVVTSLRNTLELDDHAAILNHFLPEGEKLKDPNDLDFLSNPVVIKNEGNHTIRDLLVAMDVILKRERNRTTHFAQAYQEREDWERRLREALSPMIEDYCLSVENGPSSKDKQKIIWAMENYTKEMITGRRLPEAVREGPVLAHELERAVIYRRYGHEPKALSGGSCPPNRNNSLEGSSPSSSAKLPWQEHQLENSDSSHCDQCSNPEPHFHCPKDKGGCGGTIESGKGATVCPRCGLTKEKAGSQCG